jgi:hypothetical protein
VKDGDQLVKPFVAEELRETIEDTLGEHASSI